jgi:uncharacterized protein YjiS (DUF1127 family)
MICCCRPGKALSIEWARDGRGLRDLLRAAWRAYWQHRVERAAAEFVRLLNADALDDIGISRSELVRLGDVDARWDGDCPCLQPQEGGSGNGCAHTG